MRDTQPSLKTTTGNESKVMNLRPLEKEKHVTDKQKAFKFRAMT